MCIQGGKLCAAIVFVENRIVDSISNPRNGCFTFANAFGKDIKACVFNQVGVISKL